MGEIETSNLVGRLIVANLSPRMINHPRKGRGQVVRSLWAGVQPTLDTSAETFISVKCASPGISRCVRCMYALCRVEEGTVGVSSLSGISKRAPSRRDLLSGYARTGTYSAPALIGTSSVHSQGT